MLEELALEAFVQEPDELGAAMQTFSLCPVTQIVRPLETRLQPFVSAVMEPTGFVVRSESREAPTRCFFVEVLPDPLHDDESAAGRERGGDPVDDVGWIRHVMKRCRGNDRLDLLRQRGGLELGTLVIRTCGRLRVDPERVIAVRVQPRHEAAFRTAAEVDDVRRGRRQPAAYERPCGRDPSLARCDPTILGFSGTETCADQVDSADSFAVECTEQVLFDDLPDVARFLHAEPVEDVHAVGNRVAA